MGQGRDSKKLGHIFISETKEEIFWNVGAFHKDIAAAWMDPAGQTGDNFSGKIIMESKKL